MRIYQPSSSALRQWLALLLCVLLAAQALALPQDLDAGSEDKLGSALPLYLVHLAEPGMQPDSDPSEGEDAPVRSSATRATISAPPAYEATFPSGAPLQRPHSRAHARAPPLLA